MTVGATVGDLAVLGAGSATAGSTLPVPSAAPGVLVAVGTASLGSDSSWAEGEGVLLTPNDRLACVLARRFVGVLEVIVHTYSKEKLHTRWAMKVTLKKEGKFLRVDKSLSGLSSKGII